MSKFYSAETQQGHSPHFFHYIKKIAEATSTQEEDQIIEADLADLRRALTERVTKNDDMLKEYAVRAYYAELLGHSAEFAYIHCINLACSPTLSCKKMGYLATGLMVSPNSELMYLLVATIQRDLKSPNYYEVAAALTAATTMLRTELMTVVNGELGGLLLHEKPLVRRKAVDAMRAFYVRSNAAIGDVAMFRQALCDRDPSVMDAATRLLQEVILRDSKSQLDLLDSFLQILSQVIERRLPRTYDYHRMPAPWLQIRAIQIITLLIGGDLRRAEKAAPVLQEAMRRADNGKHIGFAVICELIRTAASIPALPELLQLAGEAVSGLINARDPNLRCAGIQALSYMVRVEPTLAADNQEIVMCCLEDTDDTIRRKTIWLLFAVCNEDNIGPIAQRLIRFLGKVGDRFLKRSTTRGLCRLMEQYASDPWWYISTMNRVLAVAADCVLPTTIQRMLRLIAEGQGISEEADAAFRVRCVEAYVALTGGASMPSLNNGGSGGRRSPRVSGSVSVPGKASLPSPVQPVPEVLKRIGAWVMGEYGFLANGVSSDMLMDRLCDWIEHTDDSETRCWALTALMKVMAQTSSLTEQESVAVPDYVEELVRHFQDSRCVPLQQRCYEFLALRRLKPAPLRAVLPMDGFCEDVGADPELHFLDTFVNAAVKKGARGYALPANLRNLQQRLESSTAVSATASALRTEAYTPARPTETRQVWSAAGVAEATLATGRICTGLEGLAAPSAGPVQSVLQDRERLVLPSTATKRWGVPNIHEEEAAATEMRLQAAAAAAVGGGGIVWGPSGVVGDKGGVVSAGMPPSTCAFQEEAGGAAAFVASSAASSQAARAVRPVSAKTTKFAKSIFAGGRRKKNGEGSAGRAPFTLPSPPPGAESSKAMDALFAPCDAPPTPDAPSIANTSARGGLSGLWQPGDASADSGLAERLARAPSSAIIVTAAGDYAPRPVDTSFTTAHFERAWTAAGSLCEASGSLEVADLNDYTLPGSYLPRHILRAASLRVVEIIGNELVAAAELPSPIDGAEQYLLAHLVVAPNSQRVTVTVRSPHRGLSEEVVGRLQRSN